MVDELSCSVPDVYKVLSSIEVNKANGPDAIALSTNDVTNFWSLL